MFNFFRRNNKKDSVDNVTPSRVGGGTASGSNSNVQECNRPKELWAKKDSDSNSEHSGQPTPSDANKNSLLSERNAHDGPGQSQQHQGMGTRWRNNSTIGQQQQQHHHLQQQGDTAASSGGPQQHLEAQCNNMAASRGNKGKGKRKPVPYNRPTQQQAQTQQPPAQSQLLQQQTQPQQQVHRSSTSLAKQQQVQNTSTTAAAAAGTVSATDKQNTDAHTVPHVVKQVQHSSGTSYANILKRLDEAAAAAASANPSAEADKKRPTHSVKPCSHVTVAASPRPVPPAAAPVPPPGTPPPPTPARRNTRATLLECSTPATADTVTAAIKLRIDLPAMAQHTCESSENNDRVPVKESAKDVGENRVKPKTDVLSEAVNGKQGKKDGNDDKRNLVNQETRFQAQLAELTERLRVRDTESSQLRSQMEDLQRDIYVKSSTVDRLQAELQAAHKESEFVRQKLKHLQEEIHTFKQKNIELVDEVQKKTDEYKTLEATSKERTAQLETTVKDVNEKLHGLEAQMNGIKEERDRIEERRSALENEREEEKKIVQEALDVAEQEKAAIKKRWEEDFEKLRTVNTDREQQMFDDFEWKLREVQQSAKRKLDEKERQTLQRIEDMERTVKCKVHEAAKQMNEVVHLKSYEAEVTQLRGLTNDQQHSLRTMSARVDELQAAEQNLQEEIGRLNMAIDLEKHELAAQQRRHDKDLSDKERALQIRLEKQRGEVAVQWEQKLHQECARLKTELEQMHGEEKSMAVELVKVQREREFDTVKEQWQRKLEQHVKEIGELKDTLAKRESKHQTELERLQTNTDRDIMELRRELDKAEMAYHERIEKLLEEHETELERLNEEADRKVKEAEQNCQMQVSTMRATLELVKEQMARESDDKIVRLTEEHRRKLDEQWQRFTDDKEEELQRIEHEYKFKFDKLKEQFSIVQKTHQTKETELLALISELKDSVQDKDVAIDQMQGNVDTLQGGVHVLNQEISNQDKQATRIRAETEHKIGELQHALKTERESLQQERQEHIERMAYIQNQSQAVIEQLQRKCQCLTKLFEEMRARYDRRESKQEDLNVISDLRGVIAEQEKDLAMLNEEKRYYQMELLKRNSGNYDAPHAYDVHGPDGNYDSQHAYDVHGPDGNILTTDMFQEPENLLDLG